MADFQISPASAASDLPPVKALFAEYAASLDIDLNLQGFAAELAGLPGDYAPPDGALLIARGLAGEALGCIALRPLAPGVAEVKRLFVRPEARGLGLGRALIEAVGAEAERLGYREIKLDTLASMSAAAALYLKLGFSPIARYGAAPYPGQLFFGKTLGAPPSAG